MPTLGLKVVDITCFVSRGAVGSGKQIAFMILSLEPQTLDLKPPKPSCGLHPEKACEGVLKKKKNATLKLHTAPRKGV